MERKIRRAINFDLSTKALEEHYPKGIDDEDYCVLEFVAERGRFYRCDGVGNLSHEEMEAFDQNRTWIDYYDSLVKN